VSLTSGAQGCVLWKCSFSIEYEHQPSMFFKNIFETHEGMLYLIPWFFFTKMFSSNSLATTTGEKNLRLFLKNMKNIAKITIFEYRWRWNGSQPLYKLSKNFRLGDFP
jgi:hypothetical protein